MKKKSTSPTKLTLRRISIRELRATAGGERYEWIRLLTSELPTGLCIPPPPDEM